MTEEHRLKYLKLLGIRPKEILPATADLIFKVEEEVKEEIHLEEGTVFLAEKAGEGIDFELSENITVIPIHLEKIIVDEMSMDLPNALSSKFSQFLKLSKGIFDRSVTTTKKDLFFAPFGLGTRNDSKLYLGFSLKPRRNIREDPEYPYKSLNFMCYLYEKDFIEPGKHGDEDEYEFKNAKLKWEISLSPDGKQWKEVSLKKDGTRNFRKTGSFIFTKLEGWIPSSIEIWSSQEDEKKYFWLRCTLLESEYEYPPRIEEISLNTATVVQKKRVKDGLLIESNGFPNQVFELTETPVLRGSLKLVLSEKWIEVEDFDGSGPESPHFTLDSLKGEIRFGNGSRGKVPRDGTVIRLEYETGKGEQGNLQAFYKSNGFRDQVFKLPETPVLRGSLKLVVTWEECIGIAKSNGLPHQVFKLPKPPVLRRSLELVVSGEKWIKVEDFDGSGPESPHFTLDSLKGEIRFGDGLRGKVPREGTEIRALEWEEWIEVEDFDGSGPESPHFTLESLKGEIKFGDGLRGKVPGDGKDKVIRALEYVTCRGENGNLQADSSWVVKEEKVKGLNISNPNPASGGKGEESIDEAFKRFIKDMKIPYRAVTSEDFEYIARQTPGLRIAQAKVIKNFDPYLRADIDGSVTVIIIPFSPLDTFNSLPEPSRGFRDAVARHLEKHRLLGTRIHVVSPEYIRVEVKATLVISKGFSEDSVEKNVLDKLNIFLHPIKGGASGDGWPVGEPVYRSVVIRTMMQIEGVDWVEKIDIHAQQGAKPNGDGDLELDSKIATVYSGEHSIEILRREGKR